MATLPKKPPAPPMKSKSNVAAGTGKNKPKSMISSKRSNRTGGGEASKGVNVSVYAKGGMVEKGKKK